MKKGLPIFWKTGLVAALVLLLPLSIAAAQSDTNTLRVSTVIGEGDPLYKGYVRFAEAVASRTDGALKVEVFPNAQLGQDEDVMEQALLGVPIAFNTDAGRLGVRLAEMGIILAPYIFDDPDQAQQFLASKLFDSWRMKLEEQAGLTVLALNYYVGGRHFLTKRPILTPADLNGLRIRTPGSPVWQETIRALGATPVALPWVETYPALQQGVVDGAEAQHPASFGSKLFEVADHISKTGHILLMNGPVVGSGWFRSLPEEQQQALLEEAYAAGQWTTEQVIASEADFEAMMVEGGATVHEVDLAPFREAAQSVYTTLNLEELKAEVDRTLGR